MRVAAAALAGALSLPLVPPAAGAEAGLPCSGFDETTEPPLKAAPERSVPYDLLGIDRATEILAERGKEPGAGWNVAVVDSGVSTNPGLASLSVVGEQSFGVSGPIVFEHGTNLAGLVAAGERAEGGPTGIAPAAGIYDLRVYKEAEDPASGGVPLDNVLEALDWLTTNAEDEKIGVVVMALSLPASTALEKAVAALSRRDVVIVVGSGNRPTEEFQDGYAEFGEKAPGEDAAGEVFPAAYADDVFAVSATATGQPVEGGGVADASETVLLSSDIDAAVPTWGAVTLATNGSACLIDEVVTSWAAGIAGGVVALLRSAYPNENATQIEARLIATASGSAEMVNTSTGHGVLQPVEALTRELAPTKRGDVDDMPRADTSQPSVKAPVAETDPLIATLVDARWWGLFAGTGLVVALLARPLLRRRPS